jgi:hypothetical protein
MNTLITRLLPIALLSFIPYLSISQNIQIEEYNCLTDFVNYNINGENTEGLLLYITHQDPDVYPNQQYSNVYLLNKSGLNLQLVCDSEAFYNVYNMQVSENCKYVAHLCYGEGNAWIDIYDLQELINTKRQVMVAYINPYPGNVEMVGWQNNLLIVESDIDLVMKQEKHLPDSYDLIDELELKNPKKYSFNVKTKKIEDFK